MRDEKNRRVTYEPPDGGWGWMIVCGSALSHIFLVPILQNFTLIFRDRFVELDFTSTDITTIVSMNASFGLILGVLSGPLLKIFGYRKVALVGGTLYVVGLLCTGVATSYIEIVIYYGMLSSLGMALIMASFSLAVNSYFLKNRSKAVGFTVTLTGLGPVALPFVISELLSSYGLKWTVFILSGLCLHVYAGALLLHPVKWHIKLPRGISPLQEKEKEKQILIPEANSFLDVSVWGSQMSLSSHYISIFSELSWPSDNLLKARGIRPGDVIEPSHKEVLKADQRNGRKLSVTCLDNDDYRTMMDSTLKIIEKIDNSEKKAKYASAETLSIDNWDREEASLEPLHLEPKADTFEESEQEHRGLFLRCVGFLKDLYDLDLLRDLRYLNTLTGLSLAFVGEVIFSVMTPIILKELGFSTENSAMFLSVIAGCDLLCRFIAPFVGRRVKLSSKSMYLIALFILLISRASIFLASSYVSYIMVAFALGVGKGFRSVYWILVLPDCVPLSKLPSASAIQSLINGILLLLSGPLMGAIIALTGRYTSLIITSNVLTIATILLWTGEIIFLKCKKNRTHAQDVLRS